MATLSWIDRESRQKKYCIYKKITTIGSASDNDVVIEGDGVLPHHARVIYDGKSFAIVSVEKGAKIVLKNKRKAKFYLKDGDVIKLGETEVRFLILDPEVVVRQDVGPSGKESTKVSEIAGLRKLYDFSKTLMEQKSIDEIINSLLDSAIDVTGADKGFLIIMEDDSPVVKAARNVNRKSIEDPVEKLSDSVIRKVIETKQPLIIFDARTDSEFKNSESVLSLNLCSVMVTPILEEGALRGILYVGNDSVKARFTKENLDVFTILGAQAALILNKAVMLEKFRADVKELKESIEKKKFGEIIGSCPSMKEIFRRVAKVATVDVPVLITGETGTGKELIAREIHMRSGRARGGFVAINCGAIPENLMESEMFGYVKGAFTGAVSMRDGKFHAARGGTIFLDEIGELPIALQVKLLRVLQDKEVLRVGATKPEHIDCRIVAASNRDIEQEVREGRFRQDLYYRLNVVKIEMPPLRERGDDIVILAKYFLNTYMKEMGREGLEFSPDAIKAIRGYRWPGNVRELQNRIKKAILMTDSPYIEPEDLDIEWKKGEGKLLPLAVAKEQFQKNYILRALKKNRGNRTKTAEELGVDPRTIYRYLEKEEHEIDETK